MLKKNAYKNVNTVAIMSGKFCIPSGVTNKLSQMNMKPEHRIKYEGGE